MSDQAGDIIVYVKSLKNDGKYIDALFFLSALIESTVEGLIWSYKRNLGYVLKEYSVTFDIERCLDTKGKTLGQLKECLSFLTSDKIIIEKISRFNKIRNECVHSLCSKTISEWNRYISKDFNVMFLLVKELLIISNKQDEKNMEWLRKKAEFCDAKLLNLKRAKKAFKHLKIGQTMTTDDLDKLPD